MDIECNEHKHKAKGIMILSRVAVNTTCDTLPSRHTTLKQRRFNVLNRRCFNVVCPLGGHLTFIPRPRYFVQIHFKILYSTKDSDQPVRPSSPIKFLCRPNILQSCLRRSIRRRLCTLIRVFVGRTSYFSSYLP